jgi:hypothetical protein
MKFLETLKKFEALYEQDPASALPVQGAQPQQQDASMPPAEPAPQTPAAPLTSEGEAMLVRLLKKALVIKPDTTDTDTILELPDVNPSNAKDVLNQVITLIRKYDPDVDLNK